MNHRSSGGLVKLSLATDETQVLSIDAVAEELTPPVSRNSAARYLIGLGLAEHRRRVEDTARAMAVLEMARDQAAIPA